MQEPDDGAGGDQQATQIERVGDRWEQLEPHAIQDHPRPVPHHGERQPDREGDPRLGVGGPISKDPATTPIGAIMPGTW